jgi:hypothetical protein
MRTTKVLFALSFLTVACAASLVYQAGCGGGNGSTFDGGNGDPTNSMGPGDGGGLGLGDATQPGDDADPGLGDDACGTSTHQVQEIPVDMLLVLDTSGSMDYFGKWTNVKAAIEGFVGNPVLSGLGVGVQFFPIRQQCDVDAYAQPEVPIAQLPGAADPIRMALDAKRMFGGTPTTQVMEGVTEYMRAWAQTHTDRKPVIVLATDGIPDDTCLFEPDGGLPNSLANAVAVTSKTVSGPPPVATFVIGVGSDLDKLDAIAHAAGTKAIYVDTTQNIAAQFEAALNDIRKQAIPCDYALPDLGAGFDVDKINVEFTPNAGAATQVFDFVATADMCTTSPTKGWYFDNPVNPTKLSLCPMTCDAVKASDSGRVDVLYGCKRRNSIK